MVLLETYSAVEKERLVGECLPNFLNIEKEVTGNPDYSMYNLSFREDWKTSKKFYSIAGKNNTVNFHLIVFHYCFFFIFST